MTKKLHPTQAALILADMRAWNGFNALVIGPKPVPSVTAHVLTMPRTINRVAMTLHRSTMETKCRPLDEVHWSKRRWDACTQFVDRLVAQDTKGWI